MLRDDIPARLDRLPWSRWHWRVVLALGIAWVLDGLEVTIVGSLGAVLERPDTLALSAGQIGWAGSLYVGGAVLGALVFGRLADQLGRKRLFMLTLLFYMAATVATAFSIGFGTFAVCRFLTGVGIGGEYAAINSAMGPLFDQVGRRVMIAATYALSGVGLALTGVAFVQGWLDARSMTACWSVVFFLASAAASSAYLTVSEVFPLEMRGLAISLFYAVGTGIGGFAAPALLGALVETGSRGRVFIGYAMGAVIGAAWVARHHAVDAEGRALEDIAPPLG